MQYLYLERECLEKPFFTIEVQELKRENDTICQNDIFPTSASPNFFRFKTVYSTQIKKIAFTTSQKNLLFSPFKKDAEQLKNLQWNMQENTDAKEEEMLKPVVMKSALLPLDPNDLAEGEWVQ